MKRKIKKLLALMAVFAMLFSVAAVGVSAETAVAGPTVSFDKYIVMDKNANVPTAEFTFTLSAGEYSAANDEHPTFNAGILGAKTEYKANFSPADVPFTTVQTGDTVKLAEDGTQKYAVKEVTIDLSDVEFTEPGIYRYIITESGNVNGITNDEKETRVLDVFVTSDDDGNLKIEGSSLHHNLEGNGGLGYGQAGLTGGSLTEENYGDNKDAGFTNTYETHDLTISKTVSGNQAYRSQYFEFTLNITTPIAGAKYTVDVENAPGENNDAKKNEAEIIASSEGNAPYTATYKFWLKGGETIVVYGLTPDTQYTVSENALDYKPSYTVAAADADGTAVTVSGTTNQIDRVANTEENTDIETFFIGKANNTVSFDNYRNGVVPTGIIIEILPYALIVAAAFAGLVIFFVVKKRRKAEQEW